MNAKMLLFIACLLSFHTTYANDLGLTKDQLNSILNSEKVTPAVKGSPTVQKGKLKKSSTVAVDKGAFSRYVESSIRDIKSMITGGYLGNLEKEAKTAYPKALKEIKRDCGYLSIRASDMKKGKMSKGELKKLRVDISQSCYRNVLKAFKQDIPKVKAYLKQEKR